MRGAVAVRDNGHRAGAPAQHPARDVAEEHAADLPAVAGADHEEVGAAGLGLTLERAGRRRVGHGMELDLDAGVDLGRLQATDGVVAEELVVAAQRRAGPDAVDGIGGDEVDLVGLEHAGEGRRVAAAVVAVDAGDDEVEHQASLRGSGVMAPTLGAGRVRGIGSFHGAPGGRPRIRPAAGLRCRAGLRPARRRPQPPPRDEDRRDEREGHDRRRTRGPSSRSRRSRCGCRRRRGRRPGRSSTSPRSRRSTRAVSSPAIPMTPCRPPVRLGGRRRSQRRGGGASVPRRIPARRTTTGGAGGQRSLRTEYQTRSATSTRSSLVRARRR